MRSGGGSSSRGAVSNGSAISGVPRISVSGRTVRGRDEMRAQREEVEAAEAEGVVVGILGDGVASSVRPDPQAKALAEVVRAQPVNVPKVLLPAAG